VISPLDIQNKVLKKEFRGYSVTEVDEFLNTIIESYEQLYRQNIESRDRISAMADTISHYKSLEETLKNTLVIAQQTGERVQEAADDKAKAIIEEANATAKGIIADAQIEVKNISFLYNEIQRKIDVYRARMTALINSQLDLLNSETILDISPEKALDDENSPQKEEADLPGNNTQNEDLAESIDNVFDTYSEETENSNNE